MCGGGGNKVTENTQQSYSANPLTQQNAGQTSEALMRALGQDYSNMPMQQIAGFSPDQYQAFTNIRNLQGTSNPYFQAANNYVSQSAAPVSDSQVQNYFNPNYSRQVAALNDQLGAENTKLHGQAVQSAGGDNDRVAVGEAEKFRQDQLARGQLAANTYQSALQAAQQDKQRQEAAGALEASFGPAALGANLQETGSLYNMGSQQQQLQQMMQNAQYQWQQGKFNYPAFLAQLGTGVTGGLAGSLGGTTTGTKETTYPQQSPWGQIAGLAGMAAGAYMNPGGFMMGMGSNALKGGMGMPSGNATGGFYARGGPANPFDAYAWGGPVGYDEGGDVSDVEQDDPNSPFNRGLLADAEPARPRREPGRLIEGNLSDHDISFPTPGGGGVTSFPRVPRPDVPAIISNGPGGGQSPGLPSNVMPFADTGDDDSTDGTGGPGGGGSSQSAPPTGAAGAGMPAAQQGGLPALPGVPPMPGKGPFGENNMANFLMHMGAGMAASGGRDAHGLPIGGGPLGQLLHGVGAGVQSGLAGSAKQHQQDMTDWKSQVDANKMMHDAQMQHMPYLAETAASKRGHDISENQQKLAWAQFNRPYEELTKNQQESIRLKDQDLENGRWQYLGPSKDGKGSAFLDTRSPKDAPVIHESDVAIGPKTGPKPLSDSLKKRLEPRVEAYHTQIGLGDTFSDQYAGYQMPKTGDIANWVGRNLKSADPKLVEAAKWWQSYEAYKAKIRHGLYGAALTGYEIEQWNKQDVNPTMRPDVIRANIERQHAIVQKALQREADTLGADRYNPESIDAFFGFPTRGGKGGANAGGSGQDSKAAAMKWIQDNPDDPRVPEIKKRLGIQ